MLLWQSNTAVPCAFQSSETAARRRGCALAGHRINVQHGNPACLLPVIAKCLHVILTQARVYRIVPPCSPEARANVSAGQRRRRERERAQREAAGAAGQLPGTTAQPPAWLNEGLARERAVIELSRLRRELAAWLPVRAVGRGLHGLHAGMTGAHSQVSSAQRKWQHIEGPMLTQPT